MSLNQFLYAKLPYDYIKQIDPVTTLVYPIEGLFIPGNLPVSNVKELVEYSKSNPGKVFFGSLGTGGSPHLVPEWIARNTGANLTHIPYKGLPDLMRAFTADDIQMMFLSLGNVRSTRHVGMLFIDFERPDRFRVNGEASIDPEDPLLGEFVGAQMIVRVAVREAFPDCSRYIPKMELRELSRFIPREGAIAPVPDWKRSDWARDALPAAEMVDERSHAD